MKIGLISDTHGLLRPVALVNLQDCELILHVGDAGTPEVLTELAKIAPLKVVRGNVDRADWAQSIPMTEVVEVQGKYIYMIHILQELDIDPAAAGMDLVLFGHSHKPERFEKDGVIYFNPGSAGRRRFSLPITMAELRIDVDGNMLLNFIDLEQK